MSVKCDRCSAPASHEGRLRIIQPTRMRLGAWQMLCQRHISVFVVDATSSDSRRVEVRLLTWAAR